MAAGFKAYDIRGRVPEELNAEAARRIGMGLALELEPGPIVVGRDVRLSSGELQGALEQGLRHLGREVIDIRLCGTEEVYFQTARLGAAGGVMVTASHNPMNYNGMKLVKSGARPISGDSGLFAIRDFAISDEAPAARPAPQVRAHMDKSAFIEHLLSYIDLKALAPLKIVTNAGNGGAGVVIDHLAPHLPFKFVSIQHEPDGRFPNGIPNPLLPGNRSATAEAVVAHQADFGVAWDGDFDRCFFFDQNGRFIEGYYLVGLLASSLLARNPGAKVIHDPRLVWNTVEMVRNAGGIPVMSKTGHAFIKERMRAEDAIYGGEMSAHHYFREFAYCDSGMIPWLLIASLISRQGTSMAEMVEDRMRAFPCSGEINFQVTDPVRARERVLDHFTTQTHVLDDTDGMSADFGDWRFNLRSSNTEPLLRLNVETRADPALLQTRTEKIADLIGTSAVTE
ncbi:phosphomannomutase [Pseudoxanthomonas japonensis]|uniref:phosphomannomutase n=1 Tax=Pseudoxanthomonas japonensis TaxID=69284 RepID=UPI00286C232F|nr:phosphomannomutase [Pseudoxanthomonas japonensis]